ncbi:hypothetical protein K030075H31_07100 [Blautia producta]
MPDNRLFNTKSIRQGLRYHMVSQCKRDLSYMKGIGGETKIKEARRRNPSKRKEETF